MSRRSRKHRKRFSCGHRGFGQYCHRCAPQRALQQAKIAARRLERQQWERMFAEDQIDLRRLPKAIVLKTRQLLAALQQGVSYWQLGGKRLHQERDAIRIPVTYRYRLLCGQENGEIVPLKVLSHEDYNPLARSERRILSTFFSRGARKG